jgi:hypothetical protein
MDGTAVTLLVVAVVAALGLAMILEYERRLRARRRELMTKYGNDEIVEAIINKQLWQGATPEQIVDSWGYPDDVDRSVFKNKTKETWKYGQTGVNRYRQRVFVENDRVVGWKSQ